MGDPSSGKKTEPVNRGLEDESRLISETDRALNAALAAQRERRRNSPLQLDYAELEEDLRRSREKAQRVQEREAEAARRSRPPEDVRITEPLPDPFGALEAVRSNLPIAAGDDQGPLGIPSPPPGTKDLELVQLLADYAKKERLTTGRSGRKGVVNMARELWLTLPEEDRAKLIASLVNPSVLPAVGPPGDLSVREALRLLGKSNVAGLRHAGSQIPANILDQYPLNHPSLNTVVCYVGPGIGVFFDTTGNMIELSFGPAFEVEAVSELSKPKGGMFFSLSITQTVRLFPDVQSIRGLFRVRTGGSLAESGEILSFLEKEKRSVLFVISPGYWQRKGFRQALFGLPGRIKKAAKIAIREDYLRDALGAEAKSIQNMGPGDIAKLIFELAIDWISPFPSYDDIQDQMRIGRANIMAMWGSANVESDLDVAARLYAREVAAQVLGIVISHAGKIGKLGDSTVRGPKTKAPTVEPAAGKTAPPVSQARRQTSAGESSTGRPGDVGSSPGQAARATGLDERGPQGASLRQIVSGPPSGSRATKKAESTKERGTDQPDTRRSERTAEETPEVHGPPRPLAHLRLEIGDAGMAILRYKARRHLKSFRGIKREGAIDTVKGYVQEGFIPNLPAVQDVLSRARSQAKRAGVDPDSIRFTIEVTDRVNRGQQELSDGMVYGVREWEILPDGSRAPREIVVFGLFESKSKGQVTKLHTEEGEWGQLERTRARVETAGIEVEGRSYVAFDRIEEKFRSGDSTRPPSVRSSAEFQIPMALIGVIPAGLSEKIKQNLRTTIAEQERNFRLVETPYNDAETRRFSEEVLTDLAE